MLYPHHQDKELTRELFANPSSEYRGAPFWAWNGTLDKDELLRQIEVFKEMGLGGFHMHVRSGMATTVRRIRTASGITAGRGSGPVRTQTCRVVPEQTSGHGRRPRIAAGGAGRSGAGPIAPAVRLVANVPAGKTTSPPKRCRPRFRSRNPARQRNPQRRRRFGWDPEWPSDSQRGGKNAPPFFCPCYRFVNLL